MEAPHELIRLPTYDGLGWILFPHPQLIHNGVSLQIWETVKHNKNPLNGTKKGRLRLPDNFIRLYRQYYCTTPCRTLACHCPRLHTTPLRLLVKLHVS
jgi:hypothetical protein